MKIVGYLSRDDAAFKVIEWPVTGDIFTHDHLQTAHHKSVKYFRFRQNRNLSHLVQFKVDEEFSHSSSALWTILGWLQSPICSKLRHCISFHNSSNFDACPEIFNLIVKANQSSIAAI